MQPCLCEAWKYAEILFIAILVILAEGALFVISGSIAVGGDVMHTIVDSLGYLLPIGIAVAIYASKVIDENLFRLRGGIAQTALLFLVGVLIMVGGVYRLYVPSVINPLAMVLGGLVGVSGNLVMERMAHRFHDHATGRILYLHVLADLIISGAVVTAGVAVYVTKIAAIEAFAAIAIGAYITFWLAREAVQVTLEKHEHLRP